MGGRLGWAAASTDAARNSPSARASRRRVWDISCGLSLIDHRSEIRRAAFATFPSRLWRLREWLPETLREPHREPLRELLRDVHREVLREAIPATIGGNGQLVSSSMLSSGACARHRRPGLRAS